MQHIPVSSSNLASVGYDAPTHTLEIAFQSGSLYRYSGVPSTAYRGLLAAGSHGTYFHSFIKDVYPCMRVG
jgi:KTSC domain